MITAIGGVAVVTAAPTASDGSPDDYLACSELCARLVECEERAVGSSARVLALLIRGNAPDELACIYRDCHRGEAFARRLLCMYERAPSLYRAILLCLSGDQSLLTISYSDLATLTNEHKQGVWYTWEREVSALRAIMPSVADTVVSMRASASRREVMPSEADVLEHEADERVRY